MKILWMTWKDGRHPQAGGAEVVNEELAKRLVQNGHEVVFLTGGFVGCEKEETKDGFRIIRLGGRFSVYWHAFGYYRKNLQGWADLVIDEMNTMPFFASYYVKEKNIMFVHQLCREIWFYQFPFPFGLIGYMIEPVYLWMLRKNKVITVSESTKKDLMRFGFKEDNINIISEGIEMKPVENLESVGKYEKTTVLSLGSVRPMKRTLDQIKAFEIAKVEIPDLRLKIAGDMGGKYGEKVLDYISKSRYNEDMECLGRVDDEKKIELMQKSHLITVTSVKEGWGLIVTEANSQGTPAAVYNVDGLRDSVKNGETGILAKKNNPAGLAEAIIGILSDKDKYEEMRRKGWEWSREINFERGYKEFVLNFE